MRLKVEVNSHLSALCIFDTSKHDHVLKRAPIYMKYSFVAISIPDSHMAMGGQIRGKTGMNF